jgi:hypothetical protein
MLLPNFMIGFMIVLIGFVPAIFMQPLAQIIAVFTGDTTALHQLIPTLNSIGLASGVFIVLIGIAWLLRAWQQKKQSVNQGATWGCAYSGANPSLHQYTATSYADNYVSLTSSLVNVKKDFKEFGEDEIFPQPRHFKTHSSDVFEDVLITKPTNKILSWLERMAVFQTGKIQHYLLYALVFLALVFLLTYFNLI